ncbi:hypothetical protein B7Y94_05570 [Candidatus Saccharibacteria bacterium 32-49-12]|nr:MAG: hypothetical protein B7Y94_05570 [Candidatus Saccharibacteria bacterium 32-49-12]
MDVCRKAWLEQTEENKECDPSTNLPAEAGTGWPVVGLDTGARAKQESTRKRESKVKPKRKQNKIMRKCQTKVINAMEMEEELRNKMKQMKISSK